MTFFETARSNGVLFNARPACLAPTLAVKNNNYPRFFGEDV